MPHGHPDQFLRALLDASPFGVVALDGGGRITLWSRGSERILGWTEDQVIGNLPPVAAELDRLPSEPSEMSLRRRNGDAVDVEVHAAPWREGTIVILTDISPRRKAQREILDLTRAERRFRELLEAAPDAIIEIDREGRVMLMNAVTEKMFGYARQELLGKSMDVLLPEHLRAGHSRHRDGYWARPVTRPMGIDLVLRGERKDGSSFPVEISLSPVHSEDGMRVTAVIRDITKRRQAEES